MFSGPETEMLLSAETGMSMLFGLEVKILPNNKIYFKMPKKSVKDPSIQKLFFQKIF